jgi:glycosyltransferase involved in cell wall biosynthesis
MKHIYMVKTYYPHWGEYTAFNAFLKYFDAARFHIEMRNVPMGDEKFRPPISIIKRYCRHKIRQHHVQEYKLNDLAAEMSLLFKSLFTKIDIIHLIDAEHTLMFLPYWLRKFRFLKKPPKIIATFHQPPRVLESLIDMEIVKQVDHLMVVAPTQAEYFKQFLPPERISTILLGIDTDHYKPDSRKFTDQDLNKFKCLGGGVWLRDYQAIFATAELLQKDPGIEFHLVAPRQVVSQTQNTGNIVFHENIPDEELLSLYRNCDLLFLPMQDATANTFLLEGCACGLPVLSTDLAAIRAYFPGTEAILVKDNDPETFAEIIKSLKNDAQKSAEMSAHARQRALELSWSKIVKEYENLYMSI